jgi:DNA recombination protein RmuC
VAERLNKLGNTLKAANNHYNDTVRGLAGQQGLYGKIERFQQLSTKANKEMTTLEPIHADIENDRLEGAAEAPSSLTEKPAPPAKLKPIS